jgi:para-nitrobenzyl esterase
VLPLNLEKEGGSATDMRASIVMALMLGLVACGDDATSGADATPPAADAGLDAPPACGAGQTPAPGRVVLDTGAVAGAADGDVWVYRGIPYAAPPVGELRFRPPAAAACWDGVRDATAFGPVCPQLDASGNAIGEEDCLTVNVWAKDGAAGAPVLVFIHGGGNVEGEGSSPVYDGTALADGGAVVVTLNYRLGALGTLAHAALSAEQGGASGNWGNLDQIAALAWVQQNIAAFGGDPARVLLFGESAGGRHVCTLLASPLAKGLFAAALMESGSCEALKPLATVESFGASWAQAAGCGAAADVPACLRGLDLATVMATLPESASVIEGNDYQSNVDGHVLLELPIDAFATDHGSHVPFVLGTNADETAKAAPAITSEAQYQALVESQFPPAAASAILAEYPASAYATPRRAYIALSSDVRFICPARRFARAAAAAGLPTWRYVFARAPTLLGAPHGLELLYVFGSFATEPSYTPTASDLALSAAMQGGWTAMAASGDPGVVGGVDWPAYAADGSDHAIVFDETVSSVDGVRTAPCDFWDNLLGL